ncbi:MAG: P-II family nitrogen regulator [Candidatus Omnitrophota bacterium]|jgi:nitrogen regulatory protein P-II 1
MKKIEAIIRPTKLDAVCSAFEKVGYPGMMITEIEGHGKQKGLKQQWRGKEYKLALLPKTKIEVVVKDQDLEKTVKAIREAAYTGEIGDGKIFISDIEGVVRIRTGEQGDIAV